VDEGDHEDHEDEDGIISGAQQNIIQEISIAEEEPES
jgi:hypothetical protein